jgi:hypothetical protein
MKKILIAIAAVVIGAGPASAFGRGGHFGVGGMGGGHFGGSAAGWNISKNRGTATGTAGSATGWNISKNRGASTGTGSGWSGVNAGMHSMHNGTHIGGGRNVGSGGGTGKVGLHDLPAKHWRPEPRRW